MTAGGGGGNGGGGGSGNGDGGGGSGGGGGGGNNDGGGGGGDDENFFSRVLQWLYASRFQKQVAANLEKQKPSRLYKTENFIVHIEKIHWRRTDMIFNYSW